MDVKNANQKKSVKNVMMTISKQKKVYAKYLNVKLIVKFVQKMMVVKVVLMDIILIQLKKYVHVQKIVKLVLQIKMIQKYAKFVMMDIM